MEFVTKLINGIEVQVAKDNEKLVDSLVANVENGKTEVATVKAELENSKTENAKLKEELENAAVSEEKLDELLNERLDIIESAKRIAPKVDTKLGNRPLMVAAIQTVNKDLVSDDASLDVVNAVFKTLAKTDRSESQRAAADIQNGIVGGGKPQEVKNIDEELVEARKERSERRRKIYSKRNYGR